MNSVAVPKTEVGELQVELKSSEIQLKKSTAVGLTIQKEQLLATTEIENVLRCCHKNTLPQYTLLW